MDLYHVTTIVKEFSGCKNVKFYWFRHERTAPRPYAEVIQSYDPSDPDVRYAEDCIDQMFELDEAQTLKDYIDQNYGEDNGITTIKKATLPIPNNSIGAGSDGCGAWRGLLPARQVAEPFLALQSLGLFRFCRP